MLPPFLSLLGVEVVGADVHRLNNLGIGRDRCAAAAGGRVGVAVVDLIPVLLLAQARCVEIDRVFVGVVVVAGRCHAAAGHAGRQRRETVDVLPGQRRLRQSHVGDNRPGGWGDKIDRSRRCGNLYIGRNIAHLQFWRESANFSNLQCQPSLFPGFEAGHLNLDGVSRRGDAVNAEVAVLTGDDGPRNTEPGVGDGDFRSGNNRTGRIVCDAFDSA